MAEIVEMIDDSGHLVEVHETPDVPAPAAPPSEAPGDSAPPAPEAAPPPEAPSAESAPASVTEPEEDEGSREVPRGVQKRIDTLTRRMHEERRQYEQQLAEIRGQLEMQTRLMQTPQEPEPVPLHQQPKPRSEDYASTEEWMDARDAWNTAQNFAEWERRQRQEQVALAEQQHQQAMQQREATLRQQHADYDEQIEMLSARGLTPQVYQALLHHEMGPDLAYYLAQHPDDLQRMASLPPLRVWRELGKIEARLESNGSAPTQTAPPAVSSSSPKPAPLTPVGSGGSGAPAPSLDDPNLSQREWEAAAERQYPGLFTRRR